MPHYYLDPATDLSVKHNALFSRSCQVVKKSAVILSTAEWCRGLQ